MLENMPINVMTILVIAILVLFALHGFRRGMIAKLSGIISLIISTFLVSTFLPLVTTYVKESTPVYQIIEQQCEKTVSRLVADTLMKNSSSENKGLIDREQIRYLMDSYGMDSSQLDVLSDNEIWKLVEEYFIDYLPQAQESAARTLNSLTKNEQTRIIQQLPVPEFLENLMLTYNNSEGYRKLDVTGFGGYLISFFANVILNILSFIATLIIVQLVVWLLLTLLGVFARLPFLNVMNHLGGLVVGALQGLIAVWILFLIVSVLSGTQIGMEMMRMIDASTLLKPLYQSNIFLKVVAGTIARIM